MAVRVCWSKKSSRSSGVLFAQRAVTNANANTLQSQEFFCDYTLTKTIGRF